MPTSTTRSTGLFDHILWLRALRRYLRGMRLVRRPARDREPADGPVPPGEARQLGAAIGRQREGQGVSREQVAGILGVDVSDVVALETGTGPDTRVAIVAACNEYRRALRQAARTGRG